MGRCVKRPNSDGETRYLAMFTDANGERRSAGTFTTEREAEQAWQDAEAKVRAGKGSFLILGRMKFRDYVEQHWLPNQTIEPSTIAGYTYHLNRYILPVFGEHSLMDIRTAGVKRWMTKMKSQGIKPSNRKSIKQALSSVLSSAVDDEYIESNPCFRVRNETIEQKPLKIITPRQFEQFYEALPDAMSKLLVETAIETGMRWSELTELRVKDFDESQDAFTVCRAAVTVPPQFHPEADKTIYIKSYPKNGKYRYVKIGKDLAAKLQAHIAQHQLKDEDLLFWYTGPIREKPADSKVREFGDVGFTEPNEDGRKYAHGTMTAYTNGKCRCEHCRAVMAAYRRKRRANGKDSPRQPRLWNTDGHVPQQWFRRQIIKPALERAGLKVDIRMHLLRHAHASWLLNGGADLVVVKERLGHDSIVTTERYLHTIDNADETALAALDKVRGRHRGIDGDSPNGESAALDPGTAASAAELLAQMAALQTQLAKHFGTLQPEGSVQ